MSGSSISTDPRKRLAAFAAALFLCAALSACNNPNDASAVRQDARQQTEQVKQELKQGANDVVAAANGVRDGINAKTKPASPGMTADGKVDLNSASSAQLMALPGINAARANAIQSVRPFAAPEDAVTKGALTQAQYDRIAGRVGVS